MRARDLGIVVGRHPTGPVNAITDVPGVRVGHVTLDEAGPPAVHTGVTVVVPHPDIWTEPVFAGAHRLNGSGELTGLEWIRESGELTTAIALTNTHSVGVVRDALVEAQVRVRGDGDVLVAARRRRDLRRTCSATSTDTTCAPTMSTTRWRRHVTGRSPRAMSAAGQA